MVHLPVDGIRVKMDADRHMIAQFGMITLHLNIQSPFDAVFPNSIVSISKYSFLLVPVGDISSVKWKIWKG
jgi:hypothetical protein